MLDMSTQIQEHAIPQLTLGWRMRMALESAGVSAQEMAEQLGVHRQTITRWTHDVGAAPKRAYVAQWAMRTGVPIEWLETGEAHGDPRGGGPKSTDYGYAQVHILRAA